MVRYWQVWKSYKNIYKSLKNITWNWKKSLPFFVFDRQLFNVCGYVLNFFILYLCNIRNFSCMHCSFYSITKFIQFPADDPAVVTQRSTLSSDCSSSQSTSSSLTAGKYFFFSNFPTFRIHPCTLHPIHPYFTLLKLGLRKQLRAWKWSVFKKLAHTVKHTRHKKTREQISIDFHHYNYEQKFSFWHVCQIEIKFSIFYKKYKKTTTLCIVDIGKTQDNIYMSSVQRAS